VKSWRQEWHICSLRIGATLHVHKATRNFQSVGVWELMHSSAIFMLARKLFSMYALDIAPASSLGFETSAVVLLLVGDECLSCCIPSYERRLVLNDDCSRGFTLQHLCVSKRRLRMKQGLLYELAPCCLVVMALSHTSG
jgi:hypothetical protein